MRYFVYTPNENLCEIEVGEEFEIDDRGDFILLYRDAFKCIIGKETWWDRLKLFVRGENKYIYERNEIIRKRDWNSITYRPKGT